MFKLTKEIDDCQKAIKAFSSCMKHLNEKEELYKKANGKKMRLMLKLNIEKHKKQNEKIKENISRTVEKRVKKSQEQCGRLNQKQKATQGQMDFLKMAESVNHNDSKGFEETFNKYKKNNPNNIETVWQEGADYEKERKYEQALKKYQQVEKILPKMNISKDNKKLLKENVKNNIENVHSKIDGKSKKKSRRERIKKRKLKKFFNNTRTLGIKNIGQKFVNSCSQKREEVERLKKYYEQAEKYEQAKEYVQAIGKYTDIIKICPSDDKAFVLRACAYRRLYKNKEAICDFKTARKIIEQQTPKNEHEESIKLIKEQIDIIEGKQWKEKYQDFMSKVKKELDEEEYGKAEEIINNKLKKDPDYEPAHYMKVLTYDGMCKYEEALKQISKAEKIVEKSSRLHEDWKQMLIGRMQQRKQKIHEILEKQKKLEIVRPEKKDANYLSVLKQYYGAWFSWLFKDKTKKDIQNIIKRYEEELYCLETDPITYFFYIVPCYPWDIREKRERKKIILCFTLARKYREIAEYFEKDFIQAKIKLKKSIEYFEKFQDCCINKRNYIDSIKIDTEAKNNFDAEYSLTYFTLTCLYNKEADEMKENKNYKKSNEYYDEALNAIKKSLLYLKNTKEYQKLLSPYEEIKKKIEKKKSSLEPYLMRAA